MDFQVGHVLRRYLAFTQAVSPVSNTLLVFFFVTKPNSFTCPLFQAALLPVQNELRESGWIRRSCIQKGITLAFFLGLCVWAVIFDLRGGVGTGIESAMLGKRP